MDDHLPLLSIIIPAYNVAAYVREAVDSALAQTYPNVEVVVVDDGSTDDTSAILDSYGDRIVLIRQRNRGLAGARNSGIAAARGDLLGWLDADDVWFPTRAQEAVDYLVARPDIAAVTTDALLIDGETYSNRRYYGDYFKGAFPDPSAQLAAMVEHNFMFVGAVVRTRLLRKYGGFDEALRRSEDYDLWIRLLLGGERFGRIDVPLAAYRLRSDSLSANAEAQWEAHLSVIDKHVRAIRSANVRPPATVSYDLAKIAAATGESGLAASLYFDCLRSTSWQRIRDRLRIALLAAGQLCHIPTQR